MSAAVEALAVVLNGQFPVAVLDEINLLGNLCARQCMRGEGAWGQKRRFDRRSVTSDLPRKADIFRLRQYVSDVPIAIVSIAIGRPRSRAAFH